MEESEKRKERLRMMRNEASEAEGSPSFQSHAGTLANPLVESPIVQDSHAISRFDYYTDPMAAYSGNKRPTNFTHSPRDNSMPRGGNPGRPNPMMQYPPPPPPLGPGNPQMPPQPNHYANQGMQHGWRPPFYGHGPIRSPMPVFNPQPEHQHHGFPNQPGNYLPMPRPGYWANNGPPFQNQGPGRGRSRGQWTNNSPGHSGSGYGRGGRGAGHRGDASSAPYLYRRSMTEDPWKGLEPVVWRATLTSARSTEMFRKLSSDAKKPRVEEAHSSAPKSNESLADYLAAAFDEAVEGGDAS
ncbi:hypothetical protein V2J09_023820 [Rumex salicifolius]